MADQEHEKKSGMGITRWIILIVAIGVFLYSGFRLYKIFSGYKAADDEYSSLTDSFTKPSGGTADGGTGSDGTAAGTEKAESATAASGEQSANASSAKTGTSAPGQTGTPASSDASSQTASPSGGEDPGPLITVTPAPDAAPEEEMLVEDAEPPLTVDWEELRAINPDIVGWLYVDGQSNISYPVCRAEDNDFYLHQTFRRQYLYAGSLFEDYHNSRYFTDPNTLIYGHNMRNGSMFGTLKFMDDQAKYDEHPFFWVLTPQGNYRYHIFAVFQAAVDSETYTLYSQNGEEFLAWEQQMQAMSNVKNSVPLSKSDKTVILSTCTSDSSKRYVVIGKCVSSERPEKRQAVGVTTIKAAD